MIDKPEIRLLLASCAPPSAKRSAEAIALLSEHLNWPFVLEAARMHRVLGLCYPQLLALGVPPILETFRTEATAIAARNLRLAAELLEITRRAETERIALVPYKGPVLAGMAYGNLGSRDFADLDFILPHRQLRAARDLLEQTGYRAARPAQMTLGGRVPGEYVFVSSEREVQVEVHTELTLRHFPFPPDLDPLIAGRRPMSLLGRPVLTFSPEDTLTLLAVHGAKDFWAELLWICDIAWLIGRPGFDWDKALARADRMGCRRMTNIALLLANQALGAAMPENALAAAKADRAAQAESSWLAERLFEPAPVGRREQLRYRMRMVEGFWGGARYAARLATTPAADDWNAMRLPGPLGFAYAFLRPLRLFRR